MNKTTIPPCCPSCKGSLVVVKLECLECGTEVTGNFHLCPVCRLEGETRKLFDLFMQARGNLKQVQRDLGFSYPTVRQKIEEMFRELGQENIIRKPQDILSRVRSGEISVDVAEKLLRGE